MRSSCCAVPKGRLRVPDYPEFGRAAIRNGLALILDNRFYTLHLTAKARDVGRELVIA
jgi:hypothetical protein